MRLKAKLMGDIWVREWVITSIIVSHCCQLPWSTKHFIAAHMHLNLAVFGIFLMVIPLHWSVNYLCSFLCLQVSVCQWAAFAVLRILFQATIHRPCTNKTLNLSSADLPVIIWSIIIFSCCYFYGKSGYMYSNFIFSLKMGKVGRQGREERMCTCLKSLLDGSGHNVSCWNNS